MKRDEIIKKIEDFREAVKAYSKLLLESRDSMFPDIVRNHDLIDETKSKLNRTFASLEKYIVRFGNNPKMNDGVWNVTYSPYNNAFTSDTLVRVGPSIDGVIDDLDIVIGRMESVSDQEFDERMNPPKKEPVVTEKKEPQEKIRIIEKEVIQKEVIIKDNKWNYCNPFWLVWKLFGLAWKHKIISGIFLLIIVPLVLAYIQHRLGWNQ